MRKKTRKYESPKFIETTKNFMNLVMRKNSEKLTLASWMRAQQGQKVWQSRSETMLPFMDIHENSI